ncbi:MULTISPECIES: hypothetical protein [Acetobacter]|uniref:Uncharacterized protein n=3 Tax=Acetobacter pasteurianus TaxID=438 RepID=A0A0S3JPM3_ACEPA|nr:hypothetical protein [Acetobacter pasteurianus]KDE19207.1 hypothetical protein AZ09_13710 [Acetobacter aceti 1023]ALR88325.1 hypothetical protein DB34_14260 [Acetobacter pasteurianus]ARW49379.1 hypothetical protein S1001342_03089 [Acetobacter pasteurianus subsp. pasteurianus]OAZ59903.1 hypothetical protein SRCM100623_02910 [Acetobacter pasteurianus]GCD57148.1 hypothetical protein NBRC3222_2485 [Acetobacter pasteurianus NBRC 3222]
MTQPDFRLCVHPFVRLQPVKAEAGTTTCACCGLPFGGASFSWGGSGVHICHPCNLLQSLNRPSIDRESILIWCPEFEQRQILALTAYAHLALYRACGKKLREWTQIVTTLATGREPGMLSPEGIAAAQTFRTLLARSDETFRRLQSSAPSHVSIALQMADTSRKGVTQGLTYLGQNLRLLPLGRLYEGADDIYPDILEARLRLLPQNS